MSTHPSSPSRTNARPDEAVFEYQTGNRSRAAIHGAFWSALTTLIPTVLNGLVFIVTSRILQPRDFGIIALAFSVVSFASGFGPTAFGEALIQKKAIRRSHVDTVFWLTCLSAVALYAALFGLSSLIAKAVGEQQIAGILMIIAVKLVFDQLAVVPNAIISRSMSFHLATVRIAIATVVSSCVCLTLVYLNAGLWALAFAQIASSMAACAAAFWGARWRPGFDVRLDSLRELSHYGMFASANRFLQTVNLDQLIIGTLISPVGLGIYNFARRLFQMLGDLVAGGFTSVTHVLLSSLQHDPQKVREAFLMASFGCSLVSFPAFMGLAAVAGDAIPLIFGPHWTQAIWPLRCFCVIGLMSGIGVIQASLITSQGKSDWWFYYQLLRNVLTVVTICLLCRHGVTVIVFAMMAQVVLLWPITVWMVSRLIPLGMREYLAQFVRPALAYLGLIAAVWLTGSALRNAQPGWRLAAEITAGAAVYSALILLLCRERILLLVRTVLQRRKHASR